MIPRPPFGAAAFFWGINQSGRVSRLRGDSPSASRCARCRKRYLSPHSPRRVECPHQPRGGREARRTLAGRLLGGGGESSRTAGPSARSRDGRANPPLPTRGTMPETPATRRRLSSRTYSYQRRHPPPGPSRSFSSPEGHARPVHQCAIYTPSQGWILETTTANPHPLTREEGPPERSGRGAVGEDGREFVATA